MSQGTWTDRERRRLLSAWRRSGLPRTRFAAENGVSPTTFCRWINESSSAPLSALVPVEVVPDPPTSAPFFVEVSGRGHRVEVPRGFDAVELRRLLEALC